MESSLPVTVADTKLEVEAHRNFAILYDRTSETGPLPPQTAARQRWDKSRKIGRGGFSTVYLYRCVSGTNRDQQCAVKEVRLEGSSLANSKAIRELEILERFSRPQYQHRFVRSFGWYETGGASLFITMEYMDKGDLSRYVRKPLPERQAAVIIRQLLEGLGYMHEAGFTHRDLKPQNILVKTPGPDWWIKIADFGISKKQESTGTTTTIGSGIYMAPEKHGWYPGDVPCQAPSSAVDIWAVGVIAWRVVSGKHPLDLHQVAPFVILERPLKLKSDLNLSNDFKGFVTSLLSGAANKRPSYTGAMAHAWLQTCQYPEDPRTSDDIADDFANLTVSTQTSLSYSFGRWTTQEDDTLSHQGSAMETERSVVRGIEQHSFLPGTVHFDRKKNADAEPHLLRASNGFREPDGSDNQRTILGPQILRDTLRLPGRFSEAIVSLKDTLETHTSFLGPHHEKTLQTVHSLGVALSDDNNYVEAETYCNQAISGRTRVLGNDHKDTVLSKTLLGIVLCCQGRHLEATKLLRQSTAACGRQLGKEDENTFQSYYWLGIALYGQGEDKEAEGPLRMSLEGYRRLVGDEHEMSIFSMLWLGAALLRQQRYAEAEKHLSRSLKIWTKLQGKEHANTVQAACYLGYAMYFQERYAEAEELFRQTGRASEKALGKMHSATVGSVEWLGNSLYQQRKFAEAVRCFHEVVEVNRRVHGEEHKETLNARAWLKEATEASRR